MGVRPLFESTPDTSKPLELLEIAEMHAECRISGMPVSCSNFSHANPTLYHLRNPIKTLHVQAPQVQRSNAIHATHLEL